MIQSSPSIRFDRLLKYFQESELANLDVQAWGHCSTIITIRI